MSSKRRKVKEEPSTRPLSLRGDATSGEPSTSLRSFSTVSLSDVDFAALQDDATSCPYKPIVVTLSDLESSSATASEDSTSRLDDVRSLADSDADGVVNEETFQQHLSLLKCRYRAELEKIEDEIAAAENCYFGTRRTRIGSVLEGYGNYATCNMDSARNKSYCKAVKLGDRVFSLSSRTSRIHKEYDEELKNEALRREAQLAAGYGYYPAGVDGAPLDPNLNPLGPRMAMGYYPPTCQADPYAFNVPGQLGTPGEGHPYGQPGYPSYLYTPQNAHLFMNYESRPSIPLQSPQMMGPSMRIASGAYLENSDPPPDFPPKRPEEELNGGDSNFNVEQFLNVAPSRESDP